jgi:hypothetical protein
LPAQLGWQHAPLWHSAPAAQPQSAGQFSQFSPLWQPLMPQPTIVTHWPFEQPWPAAHVPHSPPQALSPHCLPSHDGLQHCPVLVQTLSLPHVQSAGQFSQFSPDWQPFMPQATMSTHWPLWQVLLAAHVPQTPPQPSGPHTLSVQAGVQHCPSSVHAWPAAQAQSAAQLEQVSPS